MNGLALKIREKVPNVKIIGVDPWGSILAYPDSLNENEKNTEITS